MGRLPRRRRVFEVTTSPVGRLFEATSRVEERRPAAEEVPAPVAAPPIAEAPPSELAPPLAEEVLEKKRPPMKPTPEVPPAEEGTLAGRLLRTKRKREDRE